MEINRDGAPKQGNPAFLSGAKLLDGALLVCSNLVDGAMDHMGRGADCLSADPLDDTYGAAAMIRAPSTETRQTLVVEMTGEPNDVYHYQQILLAVARSEKRDTARVFGKKIYIFQKYEPKA